MLEVGFNHFICASVLNAKYYIFKYHCEKKGKKKTIEEDEREAIGGGNFFSFFLVSKIERAALALKVI